MDAAASPLRGGVSGPGALFKAAQPTRMLFQAAACCCVEPLPLHADTCSRTRATQRSHPSSPANPPAAPGPAGPTHPPTHPGHLSRRDRAEGGNLYNTAAVAARAAQAAGAARVLIVDWDAHAARGTQEIFEGDPSVMVVSLHRGGGWVGEGVGGWSGGWVGRGLEVTPACARRLCASPAGLGGPPAPNAQALPPCGVWPRTCATCCAL